MGNKARTVWRIHAAFQASVDTLIHGAKRPFLLTKQEPYAVCTNLFKTLYIQQLLAGAPPQTRVEKSTSTSYLTTALGVAVPCIANGNK